MLCETSGAKPAALIVLLKGFVAISGNCRRGTPRINKKGGRGAGKGQEGI